jgi:hypothetical protein
MNKLFRKITLMSGAACSFFLVSCQEEAIETVQPAIKNQEVAQAPPSMIAELRLSKFGNETLSYNPDGKLKQLNGTADVNKSGYSTYRIDYEYAYNSIVSTRYEDNVKQSKMEWRLNNGRAAELTKICYYSDEKTITSILHAAYQFNNQDQLVKVIIAEKDKRTLTLSYDNAGNVIKLLLVKNTDKGDQYQGLMKYEYNEYVGGPLELDKGSLINLHIFGHALNWIGDQHLPIFGKLAKNLLKKSIVQNFATSQKHTYSFDQNGYVKEQKTQESDGEPAKSISLVYSIPTKSRF